MKLKKINIAPTKAEHKIISPSVNLRVPCEFDSETAWELANLNRIAYRDYELYDDWFNEKNKIKDFVNKGEVIYTPKEISQKRIDEYYIPVRDNQVDTKSEDKEIIERDPAQLNKYEILATYDYLTYWFLIPEVVRFGFIAQKESKNGESPILVVFRGTREAEEWFNNFQFKQIKFLSGISSETNRQGNKTINLGFNKMYTDHRPGIFMSVKLLNWLSRRLDELARNISKRIFFQKHQKHTSSIKIFSQAYQHIGEPIYFTHQAGAISSNHNMTVTYCEALHNIVPCCDR
ncbi:MAG: hypothetical protein AAGE84_11330, partial [Cyanobacteria bacterium P01_G01_bin.39]